MDTRAFEPILLPNGSKLKNRICKAAMEENMADVRNHNQPSPELLRLYTAWGKGGAGLILSGHIMIDPTAMGGPGDVVLAQDVKLDERSWRQWISATQSDGAQFWFQINHPGRQIRKGSGLPVYGPSPVPMQMGMLSQMFEVPIEMTEAHIRDVISRFAWTARKAEELGADGVEIHAAHGYLISQFLSPISNKRNDRWGGSIENRARLLFEVVTAIRAAVSPRFGVGVKINTADFQRGGFETDDLFWVAKRLNDMHLDFIEVSGGSYESPVMIDGGLSEKQASSTRRREAYFLEAAKKLRDTTTVPVIVTGGIRHKETVDNVISSGEDLIVGVATALGLMPDLVQRWMHGEDPAPTTATSWILPRTLASAAKTASVQYNLQRIGRGRQQWYGVWPTVALVKSFLTDSINMRLYKNWISSLKLPAKQ